MLNTDNANLNVIPSKKINYQALRKIRPLLLFSGFLLSLWFIPPPTGLSTQTWHLFAIFVSTIAGIVTNLLPMGAMAVLAIALCTISSTLTIKEGLSAFSSHVVWLILIAFLLARGFIKTGLGARIAYYFVLNMGKSTLGLAYGLLTTEFLLAPFTPSNTARGAGIVYPIISALSEEYGSSPKQGTERKVGAFLMKLGYQANVITSAMFLTATAANPLIVSIGQKLGVEMSWTSWALCALVPGTISLALLPWVLYLIYPPTLKQTPEAPKFAQEKLREMGPLKSEEWIMLSTFGLLLSLWVLGASLGIEPTVSAFVGLAILLCTRVLTWEDILKEQNAWHTFIWLATLLMLSQQLTEQGMVNWFGNHIQNSIGGMSWILALGLVSLIYFYIHYAFASMTAHVSALFPVFAMVAVGAGAPASLAILTLAFLSSLCAGITHYGTGTGPVYYGAGYVNIQDWWRVGGIISIVNIIVWMTTGPLWWKLLQLW